MMWLKLIRMSKMSLACFVKALLLHSKLIFLVSHWGQSVYDVDADGISVSTVRRPDHLHTTRNVWRHPVVVSMLVVSLDEMLATFMTLRVPKGIPHYAWFFICTNSKWAYRIDITGICPPLIRACLVSTPQGSIVLTEMIYDEGRDK